jgi:hypothetical protein
MGGECTDFWGEVERLRGERGEVERREVERLRGERG